MPNKNLFPQQLAEIKSWRTVELLPSSYVALHWDWTTFEMRTADLIVLKQSLSDWFRHPQIEMEFYALYMGDNYLVLSYSDLIDLYQLLSDAVSRLPRQIVRWADMKISIQPLSDNYFVTQGRFSLN